eukprot:3045489-Lingulodinium_polyedra.AAC.1
MAWYGLKSLKRSSSFAVAQHLARISSARISGPASRKTRPAASRSTKIFRSTRDCIQCASPR